MVLKAVVDSIDEVPEQFRNLYSEKNGKYEITGIEGMKTAGDVQRVQEALSKERNDHKETKDKLRAFDGLDPEDTRQKLDQFEEFRLKAENAGDEKKLEELVEARLRTKLGPIERENQQLKEKAQGLEDQVSEFQQKDRTRSIHDAVREAGTKANMRQTAIDDALMLAERVFDVSEDGTVMAKDGVGVTPGVDPHVWLTEMQQKRPHWWPESQGGGANGNNGNSGGGSNPFSAEGWNLTKQGELVRENMERAEQMAKSAGTTVGGPRPQPKK